MTKPKLASHRPFKDDESEPMRKCECPNLWGASVMIKERKKGYYTICTGCGGVVHIHDNP